MNFQIICDPLRSVFHNKDLVLKLGIRDLAQRFRSSKLGMLWTLIQPVAVVAMFYFVFSVVFENRWRHPDEPRGEFILALFAGFLVYNLFAEIVGRSPTLITGNPNYVKKLVFPLDVLPFVPAVGAVISAGISSLILLVLFMVVRHEVPYGTALLLPILLFPVFLLAIGVSWFLSALCTYFKDVPHAVPLILQALVFLSPVLYSMDRVPEGVVRDLMSMNPLRVPIELVRGALLDGSMPEWTSFNTNLLAAVVVFFLGYALFNRTRSGFADVL